MWKKSHHTLSTLSHIHMHTLTHIWPDRKWPWLSQCYDPGRPSRLQFSLQSEEPIMQDKRDITGFAYLLLPSLLLILTELTGSFHLTVRHYLLTQHRHQTRLHQSLLWWQIPHAAQNMLTYTTKNLCWHRGRKRRSECTFREAFVVKYVRTTCLFSKLQEDVVSRKHHEQRSDWRKLLFTDTQNTCCCDCCRGGVMWARYHLA